MPTIPQAKAFFSTTLNGAIGAATDPIVLTDDPINTSGYFTIDRDDAVKREVIKYTSNTAGSLSGLTRGVDGTTPQAHDNGAPVHFGVIAAHFNEVIDELGTPTITGSTGDTFEVNTDGNGATLDTTGLTGDRTFTFPDLNGEILTTTGTQTATNKTLTSPTLTSPVLNGSLSGTAFLDEDTLVSDSATAVASQQSIKAYIDGIAIAGSPDATTTVKGISELATAAETSAGTDTVRTITPDALAGSNFGIRDVQMIVVNFTNDVTTGDGKFYFKISDRIHGMNLVAVNAEVITAGTTGTTDIQIHNQTDGVDMLSTKLTIDSGETGSQTAAVSVVIDTGADDVVANDIIRIDVDAVSTTPPKGLIINLGFQRP